MDLETKPKQERVLCLCLQKKKLRGKKVLIINVKQAVPPHRHKPTIHHVKATMKKLSLIIFQRHVHDKSVQVKRSGAEKKHWPQKEFRATWEIYQNRVTPCRV